MKFSIDYFDYDTDHRGYEGIVWLSSKRVELPLPTTIEGISYLWKCVHIHEFIHVNRIQSNICPEEKYLLQNEYWIVEELKTMALTMRWTPIPENIVIFAIGDIFLSKGYTISISHIEHFIKKVKNYDEFVKIWKMDVFTLLHEFFNK